MNKIDKNTPRRYVSEGKIAKRNIKMELVTSACSWKTSGMRIVLIQTHELGDSYGKGAIQRDILIGRRLKTAAAAAKEDYAASHRYSSNSPRWCS